MISWKNTPGPLDLVSSHGYSGAAIIIELYCGARYHNRQRTLA